MTYWQRRQKEQLKALEKSEKALMQRLTAYYRDEYAKLDKEIASFYSKYGVKKIIEYRMLLEDLSPQDRSLLIKNVEEFKEKYPNLKHIVPVRENIYKLNRLEGLQLSIIMQQAEIGTVNEQAVRRHLENLALKNANSVAELLGFGKNFYFENSEIIKNFVGVKWCDGKNFSQRIWENTDKLARYLTTDLAQGFARGESYEKLTTQIGKRFIDVAKRDIYRLVYTEGTYIMAESSAKPFEEDFENYRLSTVGDGKVCSKCNGTAENVFRFADREPGVNFPPMHPMCRCTFEIVVDDWNKWLDDYEKKHSSNGNKIKTRIKAIEKIENNDIIINKSVGAATRNYPVKLPDSKQHTKLAENQQIKGKTFAGKGTKTEIRDRFRLEREYHIKARKWEKVSGKGYVVVEGKPVLAELHWYEADGKVFELKVKRFIDES